MLGELVYGVEGAARACTYFLQGRGTSTANLCYLEVCCWNPCTAPFQPAVALTLLLQAGHQCGRIYSAAHGIKSYLAQCGVLLGPTSGKMSYGAPWERGVSAADSMPQHDMEVPGLVPDVSEVEPVMKKARQHRSQHSRQQRRWEEKVLCRERSLVDRDRCFDVIAEAVDGHRRELARA